MFKAITLVMLAVSALWASDPLTNHYSGISISFSGTDEADYAFERYYHDPTVDDHGVCYIKAETQIMLEHNALNSKHTTTNVPYRSGVLIIGADGGGVIRYKVDRDLQQKLNWVVGVGAHYSCTEDMAVPPYTAPLTFATMTYLPDDADVNVLGATGLKPGTDVTDRVNAYYRGHVGPFGDEWHWIGYGDDDADTAEYYTERWASDGKSMLFVVNPKTPALYLEKKDTTAEYYTTPAKAYFIPKIHSQTSYLTGEVDIKLVNIMTADKIYYRFDSGSYAEYTGPISIAGLSAGEHTLDYYYNDSYIKTRTIVKNPDYPSRGETFAHDGSGHGNMMWKNTYEWEQIKARMSTGGSNATYSVLVENGLNKGLSWNGTGGDRSAFATGALGYMVTALKYGVAAKTDWALAAKRRLLYTKSYVDPIGWELPLEFFPTPSTELANRGYYDVEEIFDVAAAYDLVAAHFRSDQFAGGMTPVEDLRIRDLLASYIQRCLFYMGKFQAIQSGPLSVDVDTTPAKLMWDSAHMIGALYAALAMPGYDSPYFGTSGFDGTAASHEWTPFRDNPESWKDILYTYTDKDSAAHTSRLAAFPNRCMMYNWFDGGMILEDPAGDWVDRWQYYQYHLMGHCFHKISNVMKKKLNASYPLLELSYDKANKGLLKPHKAGGADTGDPLYYPQALLVNEYWPTLAGEAAANLSSLYSVSEKVRQTGIFGLLFYNPDWETVGIQDDRLQDSGAGMLNREQGYFDFSGMRVQPQQLRTGMYLQVTDEGTLKKTVIVK